MDSAYDHIQEESYPDDEPRAQDSSQRQSADFNSEIQEAYKAISASPWAARLGGFLGTVKKQGEQYYDGARKEAAAASEQASKGLTSIISRTRAVSIQQPESEASSSKDASTAEPSSPPHPDRPESLPADIVKEAEGILARFKSEAAKRLKDIEKAEDAADEALLKFGTNIRSFLREAVTIAPPDAQSSSDDPTKVLFESKDSEGKRVIHTTRFDAQLHVIHSSLDSFLKDPVSPEWAGWADKFDIDGKTDAISKDLEKHEELRRAMEKLVPEKVEYAQFWKRYYFLRHVIESEEQRRREMLKASAAAPSDEEIGWDEDSDDDSPTPHPHPLAASKETLKPGENPHSDLLKPEAAPRHSNDGHSQADSDASYDLVSGATSRAPGSPKDAKKETVNEESDEEDWE
ncbi:BSD-domain-containing protein [Mytilinidion resinicola]|uniref:BSD-domain-containing protein n=1 Tax=Mytilinidion resinicola TaxID=574789 RepID=A0A6A6Y1Z5_9PEZI|nr:BSD-domain-containing protein [Mytilinidion resinicola]KAF2802802.1 BSD-domain-containing protein [Mytilinidion resinicola]